MKQIKLYTSKGEFVADVLIAKMNPLPEIVSWGSRLFIKDNKSENKSIPCYNEGLLVIAVDFPEEMKQKS